MCRSTMMISRPNEAQLVCILRVVPLGGERWFRTTTPIYKEAIPNEEGDHLPPNYPPLLEEMS
jgi:hypothetical protein